MDLMRSAKEIALQGIGTHDDVIRILQETTMEDSPVMRGFKEDLEAFEDVLDSLLEDTTVQKVLNAVNVVAQFVTHQFIVQKPNLRPAQLQIEKRKAGQIAYRGFDIEVFKNFTKGNAQFKDNTNSHSLVRYALKHLEQQGQPVSHKDILEQSKKLKKAKEVRLWRAEFNFDECARVLKRLEELHEQVIDIQPCAEPACEAHGRCLQHFLHMKRPGGDSPKIVDNFHLVLEETIAQLKRVVPTLDALVAKVYDKSMQVVIRYSRKDRSSTGSLYLAPPKGQKPRILEIIDVIDTEIVDVILDEMKRYVARRHAQGRARGDGPRDGLRQALSHTRSIRQSRSVSPIPSSNSI